MDLTALTKAVEIAWGLLFGGKLGGTDAPEFKGVVVMFMELLVKEPVFLLPFGLWLIFLGADSCRKLIRGY